MTLPSVDEFIGPNVTEAEFKSAQKRLVEFIDEEVPTKTELDDALETKVSQSYVDQKVAAVSGGYFKSYASLALANSDIANIPLNVSVKVLSAEDGGDYYKATASATSLTKSPYDPLAQAKADATAKAEAAKNDVITAAATDASTKAQAAETNAKQLAKNNDTNIFFGLQQLVQTIYAELISLYNLDLSSKDIQTQLLTSINQLGLVVSSLVDDVSATDNYTAKLQGIYATESALKLATQKENTYALALDTSKIFLFSNNIWSDTQLSALDQSKLLNLSRKHDDTQLLTSIQALMSVVTNELIEVFSTLSSNKQQDENKATLLHTFMQQISKEIVFIQQNVEDVEKSLLTANERTQQLVSQQIIYKELLKLDGFDPDNIAATASLAKPVYNKQYRFGKPKNLIVINLLSQNGIPSAKEDSSGNEILYNASVSINIDGQLFDAYCTIAVQGRSSAGFPKKNLTFAFYSDAAMTTKINLSIDGVVPHQEWVFKANFIDATQARNLASNLIWERGFVQTRKGYPRRESDPTFPTGDSTKSVPTGALCHPMGFPCVMNLNGDFYGLGTWLIGKKRDNYNISSNKPLEILIDPQNIVDYSTMPIGAETFEIKSPKTPTAATLAAIQAWRDFAQSAQADFTANANTYLDKTNIVDFFVFSAYLANVDGYSNNTQFVSWNGTKWYFLPYDLDQVWGLKWTGDEIYWTPTQNPYPTALLKKKYNAFKPEIEARYKELRDAGIISVDYCYEIFTEIMNFYGNDLFQAEFTKWNTYSKNITGIAQIMDWTQQRLVYLDTFFNYSNS